MVKKGTLLINRTLLSENTLATVFNESASPAAEIKTRFKFFSGLFYLFIYFGLDEGRRQRRGGVGVRRDGNIRFIFFSISYILEGYICK